VNLGTERATAGEWIFPPVAAIAAFLAGRNGVHRAALAVEMHEAALKAEEARAGEARRAVAEERRRIAREMHDVVAHSISVMVVQAAGARRILERDPSRAEQAAGLIERTGRETLLEMRRLLGVMHDGTEPAGREPAPTLADLNTLAARGRDLGLNVTVTIVGEPRPLSTGLDLGAYRVLEHALHDLHRSDPAAAVHVTVHWTADALELVVTDDRIEGDFDPAAMLAVRERVAVYGGDISLTEEGGRALHVRFPLQTKEYA
jgi:signal transduction histidine kinase